jgi:hypothetical protein
MCKTPPSAPLDSKVCPNFVTDRQTGLPIRGFARSCCQIGACSLNDVYAFVLNTVRFRTVSCRARFIKCTFAACYVSGMVLDTIFVISKTMNKFYLVLLISITSLSVQAAPYDLFEVHTSTVRISFDEVSMELIMVFSDEPGLESHSIIDLSRLEDLEYRTRVMRYFGGLLKNQTHPFKTLCLVQGGERIEMPFTRENVSAVVTKMCGSATTGD